VEIISSKNTHKDPSKILVLGGINMNLIASSDVIPEPGQTVSGNDFYITPGGKGANQAVGAARMGAHVSIIGRVGSDQYGVQLIDNLVSEGINIQSVVKDPTTQSGVAIILLDKNKQNYIVQVRGANLLAGELEIQHAAEDLIKADVLMIQNELPVNVTKNVACKAKELDVKVIFDPAPSDNNLIHIMNYVDVLMPNQNETKFLTGIKVTDPASAKQASNDLLKLGVSDVVIKMGELGAYYANAQESGFVPSIPTKMVDSVAAGDAFGAAFAVSLAEGLNIREAVIRGCAAGSISVSTRGAQASMPHRNDVDSLIG
jgi:ribokinase